MYGSSYEYKSTGASSSGGMPPGTDSNGDVTDTMITDNGDSSSETILNKYDYLPNKTVQNIEHEIGAVKKDESSIAIVLTHYRVVKEETLESQGALDNMTFDEYVDANSNVTEQQVPTDLSQLVAAATGITENNIQRHQDTPRESQHNRGIREIALSHPQSEELRVPKHACQSAK